MKILFIVLTFILCNSAFSNDHKLFCHGDGIRSTLFYWDTKNSFEFVDIEFMGPEYLESYLACTNFLSLISDHDRNRKITYAPLINSFKRNFVRFADSEKSLFYQLCQKDKTCRVKFPYSLLRPNVFWDQVFHKKDILSCEDNRAILKPLAFKFPDHLKNITFWKLPKIDLIKEFWKAANAQSHDKIIISAMTFSLDFLNALKIKYQKSSTLVYILASFNMMSMDDRITNTLADLPPNIIFIPIFQNSQEPFSHHQKGAVLFKQDKATVIWNSSNFRKYETNKLVDIGMTTDDYQWGRILSDGWIKTAALSCFETKAMNCNLQARFSNSPEVLKFWKTITEKSCSNISLQEKSIPASKNSQDLILELIANAKSTIHIHTHILGNSLILSSLKEAHARGIDVKIVGGKVSKLRPKANWIRFISSNREYHAKFMIFDDKTFFWGTGNITKTSFNNRREDSFYGSNPEVLYELKNYFEASWKLAKE
jgi:hypothetical protein